MQLGAEEFSDTTTAWAALSLRLTVMFELPPSGMTNGSAVRIRRLVCVQLISMKVSIVRVVGLHIKSDG